MTVEKHILAGAKGLENLHLITCHMADKNVWITVPVFFENGSRPTHVNSLAIGFDGSIFCDGKIRAGGRKK